MPFHLGHQRIGLFGSFCPDLFWRKQATRVGSAIAKEIGEFHRVAVKNK